MEPVRFEQEKKTISPSQLGVCVRRPAVIGQGEHKMPSITPPTAHLNNTLLVFLLQPPKFSDFKGCNLAATNQSGTHQPCTGLS